MLKLSRIASAALIVCAFASAGYAQTGGTAWRIDRSAGYPYKLEFNVDGTWKKSAEVTSSGVVTRQEVPHVATNAILAASATTTYPYGVWRDDYSANVGASPLWFTPLTGTCAANSLVNDGGSCVDGSGGNSWKAWWDSSSPVSALQFGVVVNSSGAAAGNCTAVNAALTAINTRSGGRGGHLRMPIGDVYTSCTIDNLYKGITVSGWTKETAHDAGGGTPPCNSRIVPTFAGTVLKHRTPHGTAATPVWSGGGFVDMCVIGSAVATRLLEVDSVRRGVYHLYLSNSVGTEAAYFTSGVTGTDFGEAADIQHADVDLAIRQLDNASAQAANGVVFTGSTNANFSLNKVRIRAQMYDGRALDVISADNNEIESRVSISGSGSNVYCRGRTAAYPACEANKFILAGGTSYAEGTGDPGVTAGVHNYVYLDTANGTAEPTAGTGSNWGVYFNSTNSLSGVAVVKLGVGTTATVAGQARDAITSESFYVRNGSQNHMRLTDGTNTWAERLDGSGNIEFLRIAGTGVFKAPNVNVGANQVVTARQTGWGAPTGTLDRTALGTYAGQTVSAGYVQAEAQATDDACKKASQELGALITDLRTHGLIGN